MDFRISDLFISYGIEYSGSIPMDNALIINRRLYERTVSGFAKNVIVFLVPYLASETKNNNISLYAAPQDYHIYMKGLFSMIEPALSELFPGRSFKGMSDSSPINETKAAALCGLGIIGDNTRLINEKYGSFVFIGEIYTDAEIEADDPKPIEGCLHCGLCASACPAEFGKTCLSEITQKKGVLSEDEKNLIKRAGSAWGCDVCQTVCPLNSEKCLTGIEFFKKDLIYNLNSRTLSEMTDEEFRRRAFSWRGKSVPERNLRILEQE